MTSKMVLLDVDGVLLDWNKKFHQWMEQNGHLAKSINSTLIEDMYDLEIKKVRTCIRTFNETDNIKRLEPIDGAVEAIALLKSAGYTLQCITSLSTNSKIINNRNENLSSVFGANTFLDTVFLNTYSPKKEILEQYSNTNAWWIEDNLKNAKDGADVGLKSIFFSSVDAADSRIFSTNSWKKIIEIIIG
jgi:FMN phosphatase YigB (HAD superfamily)